MGISIMFQSLWRSQMVLRQLQFWTLLTWVAPRISYIKNILVPAMEVNRSITECTRYTGSGHLTIDAVKWIVERNKSIQSSNTAMAASMSDAGDWCGDCPQALIKKVLQKELQVQTAYLDPAGDRCFCNKCFAESGDNPIYIFEVYRQGLIYSRWDIIGLV